MTVTLRIVAVAACLLLMACKETPQPEVPDDDGTGLSADFERSTMTIENDNGERLVFDVYLALTFEQQRQGLMHVRSMPEMTGMLFIYGRPSIRSIWMKNTYIPLDIIFVRPDSTVSSIDRRATPLTENSRSSVEPVKYIIELNGGVAEKYNIGTGSRIVWEVEDNVSE